MKGEAALAGATQVAFCVPDNIGRLIGKRLPVSRLEEVLTRGLAMPDYYLITGVTNVPHRDMAVAGATMVGFRDGVIRPIRETAFRLPSEPGTAFVLCDSTRGGTERIPEAPRSILARQVARLEAEGIEARFASELEFYLYRTGYTEAYDAGFRDLVPCHPGHADNDILTAGVAEPIIAALREAMAEAGMEAVGTQGEGGAGQYEINLAPADPMGMADRHVIFKHLVKATARAAGVAVTFMAKPHDDQVGSGFHVHFSLRRRKGRSALGERGRLSAWGRGFLAGLLGQAGAFMLLYAPYANSYRRFAPGSYVPMNALWAWDNRTVMARALQDPDGIRLEFRLPGADANPYHVFAAMIAAGLDGAARGLTPPEPIIGDASRLPPDPLPWDFTEAIAAFAESDVARSALGADVQGHLVALAKREREAARLAVTDWDLARGFEFA
ncbi:MAG: glutamine synthetase [Alphaproteobacteria bacterium]|nr:glutamine synthetase [Alphaproteobacteria bacterium]